MSTLKEELKKVIDLEDDIDKLRKKMNDLLNDARENARDNDAKEKAKPKSDKSSKYKREALNALYDLFPNYTQKIIQQIFSEHNYDFTTTYSLIEVLSVLY